MSRADPGALVTACATDVGKVRASNQDAVAEFVNPSGCRLVVVADGMGGHAGGEVASRTCIERIGEVFDTASGDRSALLRSALEAANERVFQVGNDTPGLHGMGTTAVAMLFDPAEHATAWVAHVGDSRAYRLRSGELERLTDDHSWVFEEVRQQRITPEEAEVHPRRNALLRSIGVDRDVQVDVSRVEVAPNDRFLLCSDGLWGEVDAPSIAGVLSTREPRTGAQELIELANQSGGRDNITVAFMAVPPAEDTQPRPRSTPAPGRRASPAPQGRSFGLLAALAGGLALLAWLLLGRG